MFRRLLMTLAREGDHRLWFQSQLPISNQIKEFNGQIPDEWSYFAGPIVAGTSFGYWPVPLPTPPPPHPPAES